MTTPGRSTGRRAREPSRSARTRLSGRRLALLGAVVAGAVVALIVALETGDSGGDDQADTEPTPQVQVGDWEDEVRSAFGEAIEALPKLVQAAHSWRDGSLSDAQLVDELRLLFPQLVSSRDRLQRLEPPAGASDTLALYQDSSLLIVESSRLLYLAASTPPGGLRDEIDRLATRVKVLGDRIFDRGRALTEAFSPSTLPPEVELILPEEVPQWEAEGLAAGPPFADAPPPPPPSAPPVREGRRSEQSGRAWRQAVARADIPAAAELDTALNAGDPAELGELAERFIAAAEELRREPDPEDDRELSARVRLSLLVYADAARAGQAAALSQDDAVAEGLALAARRLGLIADRVWSLDLDPRRSGGDAELLRDAALAPVEVR